MSRYERNSPAISPEEQKSLAGKHVFVAGCGGLGGYIIEFLSRIGIGFISAADGDVFTLSNLNRQLLSTELTLGRMKAECAKERISIVNPNVSVNAVCEYIDEENADALISGHDIVVDALDNGKTRLILAAAARKAGIPFVSGAIGGWHGRVIVLYPEDNVDFLWMGEPPPPAGNLCCTAAHVASIQSAEVVKVLLGRPGVVCGKLLEIDLLNATWDEIPLDFS
ncbi:MAG: HesA/MoeB/ThiF family protein [Oscillospiraceae bacterium]|nr:HesA/MoeB/ThiF family protein [Oscillospiraceae bacterium]